MELPKSVHRRVKCEIYDAASRLQTVIDGANSATYSYLANSPLVSQILFTNSSSLRMTTTKQYDYLNRLLSVSSAPSASSALNFSYSYNNANQRTRRNEPDGSYWRYGYDSLGQVISGDKFWSDETPVAGQQFGYSFDDIGNRTQTKAGGDQNGGFQRVASYNVNNLNQYTSRDVPGAVDVMGISLTTNTVTVNSQATYRKGEYFRDQLSVNNSSAPVWQSVTVAATGQASVNGNAYVAQTPEQFAYDADGNLSSDGRWNYTWDAENRLVAMTNISTVPTGAKLALTFAYDSKGRRIQKQVFTWSSGWVLSSDSRFAYDGWNLLAILNTASALVDSFTWGLDLSGTEQGAGGVGGLLKVCYVGSQTTNCFSIFDGNGNDAALVNAADGTTSANYEYGPFGEVLRATGPIAKVNPMRFSTKYQDDEADLLYYGYRSFNMSTGRWLSRDPAGEVAGENLYGFVQNRPVGVCDILGLAGYQIVNLQPPTGWWLLSLGTVPVGDITLQGFQSRYLPTDGRYGNPTCPCAKENIFLAQVVYDALKHPVQFDVGPKPGALPPHKATDPIFGYYYDSAPADPLTIVDAPHYPSNPNMSGTWEFEDCAVCRTHPDANSTVDRVLGCVKFIFHRTNQNTAELSVRVSGGIQTGHKIYVVISEAPGIMWTRALQDWVARGN